MTTLIERTHADTLIAIIVMAYNGCALQYHPLVIGGITVTMEMHREYNALIFTGTNEHGKPHKVSFNAYDDTENATEYMINACVLSFFE